MGGLAAAAVALGLAAGFAFRPDHRQLNADDRAEAQVKQPVPIHVDAPPPPAPLPRPAGKLEVLNPATAEAARAAQPAWASAAPPPTVAPPPRATAPAPTISPMFDVAAAAPPRVSPPAAQPPVVVVPRADPLARCAGSRSRAEALVCADPQLAAYDRDLARAYRRAMRSGAVSPQDLQADQRDWMDVREQAARRSPEAMADVYAQRIDELNRIADDGPGD